MAWTPWISRRLSGLVGTFDYSGAAFFGADGAGEPLVSRRRDALERLSELFHAKHPRSTKNRFGFDVQWCRAFPSSWLEHPQYVGAVLSIWGCFFIMRYPQPDWYMLPVLESLYYALGARFER